MKAKNNIFRIWWFSFIIFPVLSLAISFLVPFLPKGNNWSNSDKSLLFWLVIIALALIMEIFMLSFRKIKYRSNHYLYILISSNLSLFISFVFNRFDLINIETLANSKWWWWVNFVLQMVFEVVLLFVVKMIVWFILNLKQTTKVNKDVRFGQALEEIEQLKKENTYLKTKLFPEEEKNEKEGKGKIFFFRKNKKEHKGIDSNKK